ncbi:hypothetical protein EDB89DRAFT_146377 [Lactarius sanguifluus]|nr:hypothetical protein EDB89DRAFT_146377 [Lactarius sanguifluus]
MFSLKTFTQALLVASIATSSLAAVVPDRYARHEARAASTALSKNAAGFVKTTGGKELIKETIEKAVTKIKNHFSDNTTVAVDAEDVSARALPNLTPEIKDLLKTSAVGGLVGGAATATVNGLTSLFDDKQARDLDLDARAIPNLTPEIKDLLKTSAVGGLVGGAATATINGLTSLFDDKQARDLDLDARAIPNLTPEIKDLLKTSAVGGLVGGAATATINGLTSLFDDKQTRDLSDDDLQLLSILSRRMLEELD